MLAEASSLLSSLDYHATLEKIPKLVVPALAEACSVWYAEHGTLRKLSSYTADPDKLAAFDGIPTEFSLVADADTLIVELFRAGEPVLMQDVSAETLRTAARNEEEVAAVDRLATRSAIVVPLVARGRSFGLLNLISFVPGRFRSEDVALAKELTDRVALALDRALLFRASEEARERLEYLARAGQDLNATLDYEDTLSALGALVVPRLATWPAPPRRGRRGPPDVRRPRRRRPARARRGDRSPAPVRPDEHRAAHPGRALRGALVALRARRRRVARGRRERSRALRRAEAARLPDRDRRAAP